MNKIIDKQDRTVLGEGRNYQLGYAFLKKLRAKDTYETTMPISPCKDYLNDVVYSEATGKVGYAFGLHTIKKGIFKSKLAYMAIKICPYTDGSIYQGMEKDVKRLKANYKNIEKYLNLIEDKLGVNKKTLIEETKEKGLFLVKFDKYWVESTYLISMYTLLMRIAQWYDGVKDIIEYLDTFSHFGDDIYLLNQARPKIKYILEHPKVEQDLNSYKYAPHGYGILSFTIPI